MTNVMSTAGLVAIVINAFIVVRYGRRRVLITTGLILCGICQLIMAVVYDKHPGTISTGRALVGMSSLYMFFFNVSACFPLLHRIVLTINACGLGHDYFVFLASCR